MAEKAPDAAEPPGAADVELVVRDLALALLAEPGVRIDPPDRSGSRAARVDVPPERVAAALAARARRLSTRWNGPETVPGLAGTLDHTLLRPDATAEEIDRLCDEALRFRFAAVCVHGVHVRRAALRLQGSGVRTCCVVGFPLGAQASEVKAFEARRALADGAAEIDVVIQIGALRAGDDDLVRRDVAAVAEPCRAAGAGLKAILETALLSDREKVRACAAARDGGASFVKTSTGFGPGGATTADVALLRRAAGPTLGVKASGGIRTARDARAMLAAGASRIGTSAAVAIVEEDRADRPGNPIARPPRH